MHPYFSPASVVKEHHLLIYLKKTHSLVQHFKALQSGLKQVKLVCKGYGVGVSHSQGHFISINQRLVGCAADVLCRIVNKVAEGIQEGVAAKSPIVCWPQLVSRGRL